MQKDKETQEEPKQKYQYIGECNGNNQNGCFLDSPAHDCGCFTRVVKDEPKQENYTCPHAKIQCDDECCVSAEDRHIEAGFGIISDCESPKEESKQEIDMSKYISGIDPIVEETLEEVAERYYPINNTGSMFMPTTHESNNNFKQKGFIAGAKSDAARDYWFEKFQQEQDKNKYSEEEAKTIWRAGQEYWKTSGESITFEELIEQFKKK